MQDLQRGETLAAGEARIGQQLLRLGKIEALLRIGVDAVVEIEPHGRVDGAEGRDTAPEQRLLDELLPVQRLGDGKADHETGLLFQLLDRLVEVGHLHRLAPRVQEHALEAGAGHDVDVQVRVGLEPVGQFGGDRVAADEMDVARLDGGGDRLRVDDRYDHDFVQFRPVRVVVVLEPLQGHRLAKLMVGDPERTGADRLQAVIRRAHALDGAARDDGHGPARGALEGLDQHRGLRLRQRDLDLVIADPDHVGEVADHPAVDRLVRVLRTLIGVDHIIGGEGIAVVEGDPLAQVEDVFGAGLVDLPVYRQVALGNQLRVDMGQPAQHVRGNLEQQHLVDLRRVDGAELAHPRPAAGQPVAG